MNWFAPLWYTFIGGLGYGLSQAWYSYNGYDNMNHQWEAMMIICGIYFGYELLQDVTYRLLKQTDHSFDSQNENTTCIIPCYQPDIDKFTIIVERARSLFHHVIIAENGSHTASTLANLLECEYQYYSLPNKTNALVEAVKTVSTKYVCLLDDDTLLPEDFKIKPMTGNVAGYCPRIGVRDAHNWLEKAIDVEYRSISRSNEVRSALGSSIRFLHGVCAIYDRVKFLTIYEQNPCLYGLPYGEDSFAGVIARRMGYKLIQDDSQEVLTFAVSNVLWGNRQQGFGASCLVKQRMRWYVSWLRRLPDEFGLFWCYDCRSWSGNVVYRIDTLVYILVSFIPIMYPLWIAKTIVHGLRYEWLLTHAFLYGTGILGNIVKRSVLTFSLSSIFYYPLLTAINCILYVLAFVKCILWYIPLVRVHYH